MMGMEGGVGQMGKVHMEPEVTETTKTKVEMPKGGEIE